jgi:GMP synthase (glutamine-hydrolysing)
MQTEPPIPLLICQEIWQNFLYRVEATETERKRKIIGEVTAEKVKIVQDADAIYREEIDKAGLSGDISQYYAALTNMQTVGVMGDFRTYDYAIALRAVITSDFMTATAAEIPWDVLQRVMTRIVNEVDHVNRVF